MAIPVHLQQFKAAGIYRVVFDKSTILNTDTQILRLVVGYSEKGPFNIPVLVKNPGEFKELFGGISRKLEKRGIFFHRLALQMLNVSPILCLNLKKFDGEQVGGATISTDFNPKFNPIDEVKLNVEDIYDTTRFWEFKDDKLNNLRSVEGNVLDQYINICTTNTSATSATYFIRKASGKKVSGFNITVNDWYSDGQQEMPEYLEGHENNLISDFFAEIYVFKGKFTAKQVLASESLKNYFIIDNNNLDENGQPTLILRDKVIDAFGDSVDTLDTLYQDETSGAIGHYIGSLIPEFVDKQGGIQDLRIIFNNNADYHNMMMSFNTELLEESNSANIDLSGRLSIPTNASAKNSSLSLKKIFEGTATTNVLGNMKSPVIADKITFGVNIYNSNNEPIIKFNAEQRSRISGTLYVSGINKDVYSIVLQQVGNPDEKLHIGVGGDDPDELLVRMAKKFGVTFDTDGNPVGGTYWSGSDAFNVEGDVLDGPEKVITAISRVESLTDFNNQVEDIESVYTDVDNNLKISFLDVIIVSKQQYLNPGTVGETSVYDSSVSFIDFNDDNWEWREDVTIDHVSNTKAIIGTEKYDSSLLGVIHVGDCLIAADGTVDMNRDGEIDEKDKDEFYDNVYVQEIGTEYYEEGELDFTQDDDTPEEERIYHHAGEFKFYYITTTNTPTLYVAESTDGAAFEDLSDIEKTNQYVIRLDRALNQEIGVMRPQYLEGYTYKNSSPAGTGMYAKVQWQNFILSTLTDYKGLRTGLLNKSEIDYRYVIDTFESFPVAGLKEVLSKLCKEKQSAFCIGNFPSVQTFVKCPYTSFTDNNGVFNVNYVVAGYNKKKSAAYRFSLPQDIEGASFIAFYTPLKFSEGYVDILVPSAGLVSNLFIEKYMSRQPYYIVAGPNYGNIAASGLIGPDYKYSQDELQIIEPFGVNVMVYRPNFGTFINANQTAKQTPVSALSKVHVRELVIYLQDEIEKVLQSYQWEFNNQRTRNAILDKANQICELVMANGGLQDYVNIMDESNNTPEIIDNEMAVISTHIEPGMGCGKMVQELTLYRTGQMRAAISD